VQLVIELVGVSLREQFSLQCISEQTQRCWRTNCFGQAVPDWGTAAEKPAVGVCNDVALIGSHRKHLQRGRLSIGDDRATMGN